MHMTAHTVRHPPAGDRLRIEKRPVDSRTRGAYVARDVGRIHVVSLRPGCPVLPASGTSGERDKREFADRGGNEAARRDLTGGQEGRGAVRRAVFRARPYAQAEDEGLAGLEQ